MCGFGECMCTGVPGVNCLTAVIICLKVPGGTEDEGIKYQVTEKMTAGGNTETRLSD